MTHRIGEGVEKATALSLALTHLIQLAMNRAPDAMIEEQRGKIALMALGTIGVPRITDPMEAMALIRRDPLAFAIYNQGREEGYNAALRRAQSEQGLRAAPCGCPRFDRGPDKSVETLHVFGCPDADTFIFG